MSAPVNQEDMMELRGFDDSPEKEEAPSKGNVRAFEGEKFDSNRGGNAKFLKTYFLPTLHSM